jgi:hypothetical protein
MKQLISYTLILFVFFSCQKVLDLDADTKKSKLVVNTLFSEEKEWRIELTKSLSVLDGGELSFIDNAQVNILDENNNLVESLPYGFGYYKSALGLKPIAGKKYKIEVSAPNFTAVSAADFCPSIVPILNIDTSFVITAFAEKKYTATINFQDPPNTENFYGIELEVSSYTRTYFPALGIWDTTFNSSDKVYLSSSDPLIDNGGTDSYSQTLTFKDNLFNGQQKSLSVNYMIYESGSPNQFFVKNLRLSSYTEASYNYSKSIEAYLNTEGNPFAEPVQVYSNVDNGFGIFGGQSSYEIEF